MYLEGQEIILIGKIALNIEKIIIDKLKIKKIKTFFELEKEFKGNKKKFFNNK